MNWKTRKYRLRWYQLSLRAMLAATVGAGLVSGWLGAVVREYRVEQAVIAEIQAVPARLLVVQ